jgi:hypothetical protein
MPIGLHLPAQAAHRLHPSERDTAWTLSDAASNNEFHPAQRVEC